ncbi:TspO/MBR family protein [Arthrobacter sp. ISL-65]|uniref:TspO/MBR family protein n=1 Tax=Arthrobacter sp. ISL-65 TaxID=2819112 RepID=UPI001BE9B781|nr:TspO/MBR family protein [Arthrobacter sp. ISL-65]MBT2547547.1 tryptophan-rich sensory protein [Arthrobacter sp. ISL-65]
MRSRDRMPVAGSGRDANTSGDGAQPEPQRTAVELAALLGFLAASALVAWLGSQATISNVTGWYATADKAPWSPPNWVFGPVWTVLYAAMAVAAWLVWRSRSPERGAALTVYGVQLALNLAWTPAFFGMYPMWGSAALWLALGIIIALALAVAATVLLFGPIRRAAGLLMLPYLSWVVFASSLNLWAAANN